ncbi:MAG: DUF1538 domain-containing protein [Christensenellaceae bacterium]|jgi:hypothetical protein|nr:DUF1538 domain-containing protein [Christensenellaceae bacterium]
MKKFLLKLKDCAIGATPIIVLIACVNFIKPMPTSLLVPFIISCFMLLLGQALFLVGVDSSILVMGELVGSNIRKLRKLWVVLLFGFLFGTMATVAEPAVTVVSNLVHAVNSDINPWLMTFVVSSGIGIFVSYGLFRIFKSVSIKWSFFISYLFTFVLAIVTNFVAPEFVAVAFDFSGATTGVITVPFILALGVGVVAVLGRHDTGDSYGLIGLASVGPIITMCIMGLIFGGGSVGALPPATTLDFLPTFLSSAQNIFIALLPITVVFFIFNFAFIKLPKKQVLRTVFGILVTICGLMLFLTAINFGFSPAGRFIGEAFSDPRRASWFKYILIPFCFVLGFAIAMSEIGIRVLAIQVEQNTVGRIKKNTIILTLAIGMALTMTFGILRILFNVNILWFLIPIFVFGLACMPFIDKMFVGIGFDSGGVASGTITAAFVVPFSMGVLSNLGRPVNLMVDGFGMIAFIASIPVVAVSALGLIYAYEVRKVQRHHLAAPEAHLTAVNYVLAVITRKANEDAVLGKLAESSAHVEPLATFDTISFAHHFLNPFEYSKEGYLSLFVVSKGDADKLIKMLETDLGFSKENTGIAFTIPLDGLELRRKNG